MGTTKETVPDTTLHAKHNVNIPMSEEMEVDHAIPQRRPSVGSSHCEIIADDTFENILEVTAHHESLMTFYYMDDNDKVK